MMLRTKFFSRSLLPDGQFAIVAQGTTTRKYTFLTDSSVTATTLAGSVSSRWALGNSSAGIFGPTSSTLNKITSKYIYSSNVSVAGGDLTSTINTAGGGATSTSTFGIIALTSSAPGNNGLTNKYSFGSDTTAVATTLSASPTSGSAIGNSTTGVFAQGSTSTITDTYTYSGDVIANGSSLTISSMTSRTSMTNKDFGLFVSSAVSPAVCKYTFAPDSTSTATSLIAGSSYNAGCGNSVAGLVFNGTSGGVANRYTYGSDAVTTAGSLNISPYGALSNGITGVNV